MKYRGRGRVDLADTINFGAQVQKVPILTGIQNVMMVT